MSLALIALGGNQGGAPLLAALQALSGLGRVQASSPVYCSRAREGVGVADYLNLVVELETALPCALLGQDLRRIEAACGRRRIEAAVCHVDLDLLIWEEQILRPAELQRCYVAQPLAALRGQYRAADTGHLLAGDAWTALRAQG